MGAHRIKRPTQRFPVPRWHIALCNRQQTGQARLRCQQVVKAPVQLLLLDPVADVKEVALAVEQKTKVGFPGQRFALLRQRLQARRCGSFLRCTGQLQAGLRYG